MEYLHRCFVAPPQGSVPFIGLSKSGSTLSQSEGQILIDIMNDHGLEQMVHFPTREKNTLDLILTTLPGQFQDVHSPDKLSDHDIVSGTLKISSPQ